MDNLCRSIALASLVWGASFQATAAEATPPDGLFNAALTALGATAKGSGAPFNKDWPPNNALVAGMGRGGTLFGVPLVGGRVDIALIIPVDIAAIEVVPLDYHGTRQPKAIDIFVDGKLVKKADLPETPGKPIRIALGARGQTVGVLVTDEHPIRTLANGRQGPAYGGWSRLRVLTTTDVPALLRPVDAYAVERNEQNIAPTAGAAVTGGVKVHGRPRQTKGHPCTIWDAEDIAHYKSMLKTSPELRAQLDGLVQAMDKRITQPVGVPPAEKDENGNWRHFSDIAPFNGGTYGKAHNQLSLDIANLATVYALTDEAKYAEFAKKMLLDYADAYPNYAIGARPGFNHSPSKAFDQVLGDATWVVQLARGYDLIYNLPSMTPEERRRIEEDLLGGVGELIIRNHSMLEAPTNWSAIGTTALLIIGCATDNPTFISTALHGICGTPEKPTGGLYDRHFSAKAIDADGMWAEGAMGYQFMALQALICNAEILWHHGVDLYSHRDGVLKSLFDSPLQFAYPNLKTPAIHDSGYGSILGRESYLYEFAYRRYRDPAFLFVLSQTGRHLGASFQQFPVSVLYDLDPKAEAKAVEWKSVNFFGVGYGILRLTSEAGTSSLLLDYGPNRSHGHPDKLNIDFYAYNDRLIPDPGMVWYEQPLYRQWYRTTLAHNTLVVDELDQNPAGATQVVYGPATTFGIQRAWTQDAYPGITMDRSLFLTPEYLADIFGAFSRLPRKMDLAWHIRGDFQSDLTMEPTTFPTPVENGYSALANVRRAQVEQSWRADIGLDGHMTRFIAAGGPPTEVIVGDGHLGMERPPTILQRRQADSTVYGNVVDVSDTAEGHVKSVRQEGGLEQGHAFLEIQTARGTDTCFAAFRPGTHKAGGIATDAQQAFVIRDGKAVRALYLGGGTLLEAGGVMLKRSEPGLAYLELRENGSYVVSNPSSSNAVLAIRHPGLAGKTAYRLDHEGRRLGEVKDVKISSGMVELALQGAGQVEFAAPGVMGLLESRQALLLRRQEEQEAANAAARKACEERTAQREAEARRHPAPKGAIVVLNAAEKCGEGGGSVKVTTTKRAAVGPAFLGWDSIGHWVEWKFVVPAEGCYCLSLCYCCQDAEAERIISVNGVEQEPFAPMKLPATGGYSNTSDDWRVETAMNPVNGKPLLLKLDKGENIVRLMNSNGRSANVNYIALTSPDVAVSRQLLAAQVNGN
ncbi:MAG: heparinase II/III domain-containing protein [Kiritimatiellia bacterium]|jgi:hypothetical protein